MLLTTILLSKFGRMKSVLFNAAVPFCSGGLLWVVRGVTPFKERFKHSFKVLKSLLVFYSRPPQEIQYFHLRILIFFNNLSAFVSFIRIIFFVALKKTSQLAFPILSFSLFEPGPYLGPRGLVGEGVYLGVVYYFNFIHFALIVFFVLFFIFYKLGLRKIFVFRKML